MKLRRKGPPVTKRELVRYAAQVAPYAIRYLSGRALNMHRYPNGAEARGSGTTSCPLMRRSGDAVGQP